MLVFLCFSSGAINLAPFWRSDGYYVLCDLMRAPNLGPDAWKVLWGRLTKNRALAASASTPAHILYVYLLVGVLYVAVVGALNVNWVYQILTGSDGIVSTVTRGTAFSIGTLVGIGYLGLYAALIAFQFSRSRRN